MILLQTCIPSLECEQTIFETLVDGISDMRETVAARDGAVPSSQQRRSTDPNRQEAKEP